MLLHPGDHRNGEEATLLMCLVTRVADRTTFRAFMKPQKSDRASPEAQW